MKTHVVRVLLLLLIAALSRAAEPDAKLVQANAQQTTIDLKLTGFKFDTLRVGGAMLGVIPKFANSFSAEKPGAPDLPHRVFIIGVPTGARVEATVLPGAVEELRDLTVAPFPTARLEEGEQRVEYLSDIQTFSRNDFFPTDLVSVDAPDLFRQQRVVRVVVSPVQYNPAQKTLRIYQELRLLVRHTASDEPGRTAFSPTGGSPVEESFYRNLIFNYEQARQFRLPRQTQTLRKAASPFAEGPLYKIALRAEGMYRITGQALAGAGIDLTSVQPAHIRLFNNGGKGLPRGLFDPRPEGLVENAIYVSDGGDGRFDPSDFILFYGRGVDGFEFDTTSGQMRHYLNKFGFDNFYFLSVTPYSDGSTGKRMSSRAPLPFAVAQTLATSFQQYVYNEEELNPLFESDQTWFGYDFGTRSNTNTRTYKLQLPDPVTDATGRILFRFYAQYFSSTPHRMAVTFNQQPINEFVIPGNSFRTQDFTLARSGVIKNGENEILLTYTGSGDATHMYIDYFELNYARQLRMPGPSLIFDGTASTDPVAYRLDNADPNGLWLFDVSDFSTAALLTTENWQVNGAQITFTDAGSTPNPRRYAVATNAGFTNIEAGAITKDSPSNLRSPDHSADMIIITHDDFVSQAQRIESLRENWQPYSPSPQRLEVEIVNIQDVFDEFSSGMYDPVAIRDFLKYAYENWRKRPSFVLLFGDSDYDPKNIRNKSDKNWIPSYHTAELDEYTSRVTDSWFAYVNGNDALMDLAIGRIPARSLAEAEAYVNKLIKYETNPVFGPWRNAIIMVADDENSPDGLEAFHINDTENLINQRTPDYFDIRKLYLTEYPAVQSAAISGVRKPAATDAFMQMLQRGALIVNYAGHGNPTVWAHERLLEYSADFDRIQNGDLQACWIAATCTWGQFDLVDRQSYGEQLLLVPNRGAVAVLATSRLVFATANANLNQAYYTSLFSGGQTSETLGMALVGARAGTRNTVNDEKFLIYGDPSMRLGIPRYSARLSTPDTIKALGLTRVSGEILREGQPWAGFNGTARVEVFDSERFVNYRNGNFSINYTLPGNSLFRGEAPVTNGAFDLQFIAPKDLTYGGRRGRFSVYFWNDSTDGNGYRENIAIGGTAANFSDTQGPEIQIGFASVQNFVSGGYVGPDPILQVTLKDSISGINIAGEIGHKITLTLDGNNDSKIDVTDFFNYNSGNYTAGTLRYPLTGLSEGRHTVEVKAWDNFNNSNTASAEFVVAPADQVVLREVMNYPNPFRNQTTFTFEINQPAANVKIKIYTLAGRLIRTLEVPGNGDNFRMIPWDGRDQDGDEIANGVYLYKVIANYSNGTEGATNAEELGKLVVQR